MATNAQYAATPKNGGLAQISTANTNRDGTGTLGTVYTAGASGARIDRLNLQAVGTTTSGMIRLFINDGGANTRLIKEVPVMAVTPSGTIPAWAADVVFDGGLELQANYVLKAGTNNAETFNVTPTTAGDF